MADELQITFRMIINNLVNTRRDIKPTIQKVDWGVNVMYDNVVTVDSTVQPLEVPADMNTIGWAIFHNLSDTDNIKYGTNITSTFNEFGLLFPGEYAMMRIDPEIFVSYDGLAVSQVGGAAQLEYMILAET